MEKGIDMLTKQEFIKTRINQKFSCAKNRIKYYNNKANQIRHKLFYVNKPLHKNYLILCEVMGKNKEMIHHKEFLRGKGMNFNVQTHFETLNDKRYPAVYSFIIINAEPNIKIIQI